MLIRDPNTCSSADEKHWGYAALPHLLHIFIAWQHCHALCCIDQGLPALVRTSELPCTGRTPERVKIVFPIPATHTNDVCANLEAPAGVPPARGYNEYVPF